MLILTRKVDQAIVIQGNILVTVLRVERDRVKLGISAPEEITVLREELLERNGENHKSEGPDDRHPPFTHLHLSSGPGGAPSGNLSADPSDGN
jgi:carbon storage regulator